MRSISDALLAWGPDPTDEVCAALDAARAALATAREAQARTRLPVSPIAWSGPPESERERCASDSLGRALAWLARNPEPGRATDENRRIMQGRRLAMLASLGREERDSSEGARVRYCFPEMVRVIERGPISLELCERGHASLVARGLERLGVLA